VRSVRAWGDVVSFPPDPRPHADPAFCYCPVCGWDVPRQGGPDYPTHYKTSHRIDGELAEWAADWFHACFDRSDSFRAQLFRLMQGKADAINRARLAQVYPHADHVLRLWAVEGERVFFRRCGFNV